MLDNAVPIEQFTQYIYLLTAETRIKKLVSNKFAGRHSRRGS